MDITLPRQQFIALPRNALGALKVTIAVGVLYALCISAPAVYLSHPAITAWKREIGQLQMLHQKHRSRLRLQQMALLSEAAALENLEARRAFLVEEIERAKLEWEGYQQQLDASRSHRERLNTFARRVTGNKVLANAQQEVENFEQLTELARANVQQLEEALQAFSSP